MTIHCNFDLYSTREDASAIRDLQGKDSAHIEEDHNQRMQCYRDNPTQRMDGPQTDADMDQKSSCAAHQGRHALLVFDTFKDHLTDDILAILAKNNISHVVIPGGCTRMIQPLDVCLN